MATHYFTPLGQTAFNPIIPKYFTLDFNLNRILNPQTLNPQP